MSTLFHIRVVLFALIAVSGRSFAADKPADKPSGKADAKVKFPAPAVNDIIAGWNGLDWGASLEQFKKKFPKAEKNAAGRWSTGEADEKLAGVAGKAVYGFNKKEELNLVSFEPADADRATFRKALTDAGILRDGGKNWQNSGVTFACADVKGGQLVVIVAAKFADAAVKKP